MESQERMIFSNAKYIFLVLLFLWCAAILLTPLAAHYGGLSGAMSEVSYRVFGHVCHQWDSHSFHIAGKKLPVCIRCSVLYFAFLTGSFLAVIFNMQKLFSRNSKYILLAALSPLLLDVFLNLAGIHQSTTVSRIMTGAIAGAGLAFVLAPVCVDVLQSLIPSHKSRFL